MLHTGAWVAWLLAAAVPAFVLRNPLYLALVLGAAWVVYSSLGRSTSIGSSWGSFVRLGLFLFLLTIPFNALSVHVGEIVLFQLPEQWPIVGGPITLEAIIAGAVNGLALFTLLVVFAAFNAVVDHYQLLRATPAFLFQAGVVISIAITFVPQMVLSAKEIRQAQRIRGHHIRGIRDLLPLIMPLLASALERAIQLAETMEARGFGSIVNPLSHRQAILSQVGTLLALVHIGFAGPPELQAADMLHPSAWEGELEPLSGMEPVRAVAASPPNPFTGAWLAKVIADEEEKARQAREQEECLERCQQALRPGRPIGAVGDDGQLHGHGLRDYPREALPQRGEQKDIHSSHHCGHITA